MSKLPLAAVEFGQFLKDCEFDLIADVDEAAISYTVFGNSDLLIAFTYQQHEGENIAVSPCGSPITTSSISSRSDGWQLIGGILPDFWSTLHRAQQAIPYPHKLDRSQETLLVDAALRRFMESRLGPNNSFKPIPHQGGA
jgi:hypothetical protein